MALLTEEQQEVYIQQAHATTLVNVQEQYSLSDEVMTELITILSGSTELKHFDPLDKDLAERLGFNFSRT